MKILKALLISLPVIFSETVNILTIRKISNQGSVQDQKECGNGDNEDEITLHYESGG